MTILNATSKFVETIDKQSHVFITNDQVRVDHALEEAAILLDSAVRELTTLSEELSRDPQSYASVVLIRHAVRSANAVVWAAFNSDLDGGAK